MGEFELLEKLIDLIFLSGLPIIIEKKSRDLFALRWGRIFLFIKVRKSGSLYLETRLLKEFNNSRIFSEMKINLKERSQDNIFAREFKTICLVSDVKNAMAIVVNGLRNEIRNEFNNLLN